MATRLLETKLHAPPRRHGLVARSRLTDRLSRATESKLTLVSAPPGFGKTTLVADWVASRGPHTLTAWLSLDTADNDPASFWTYVVAALQTAVTNIGDGLSSAFLSPQPDLDSALHTLLNDLEALPRDLVFVLDDFHVIDAREVHEQMAFVLDHLPAGVHVVIATRSDPALPLARLRARGELVEIRAADLRFTADEAAAYLNGVMGLELTAADVVALESRTEGWIAALQLAALSMQGRDDVASFIASFSGDDRYVVDYLVDEVLARQPEEVRSFLLQTSILDEAHVQALLAFAIVDGGLREAPEGFTAFSAIPYTRFEIQTSALLRTVDYGTGLSRLLAGDSDANRGLERLATRLANFASDVGGAAIPLPSCPTSPLHTIPRNDVVAWDTPVWQRATPDVWASPVDALDHASRKGSVVGFPSMQSKLKVLWWVPLGDGHPLVVTGAPINGDGFEATYTVADSARPDRPDRPSGLGPLPPGCYRFSVSIGAESGSIIDEVRL